MYTHAVIRKKLLPITLQNLPPCDEQTKKRHLLPTLAEDAAQLKISYRLSIRCYFSFQLEIVIMSS